MCDLAYDKIVKFFHFVQIRFILSLRRKHSLNILKSEAIIFSSQMRSYVALYRIFRWFLSPISDVEQTLIYRENSADPFYSQDSQENKKYSYMFIVFDESSLTYS